MEQWRPSVFPALSQVAATAESITTVCPTAGTVSVFVALQAWQVYVFSPVSVQVACIVIFPESQLCSFLEIVFPFSTITPQSLQI